MLTITVLPIIRIVTIISLRDFQWKVIIEISSLNETIC